MLLMSDPCPTDWVGSNKSTFLLFPEELIKSFNSDSEIMYGPVLGRFTVTVMNQSSEDTSVYHSGTLEYVIMEESKISMKLFQMSFSVNANFKSKYRSPPTFGTTFS